MQLSWIMDKEEQNINESDRVHTQQILSAQSANAT